jgi:SAM-dependent methyltransferase
MSENICPLCHSNSTTFLDPGTDRLLKTTTRKFLIYRCDRCGVVFVSPIPSEDEIRGFYPSGYWWSEPTAGQNGISFLRKKLESIYRHLVLQDHVRFVMKAIHALELQAPGKVNILDVGCSGGTFLFELAQRGMTVKGLDFSEEAVKHAREVYHLDCVVGEVEHLPWSSEKFSVVTCFHVLEHIPDPRGFLRSARGILRQGGALILQVPNVRSWQFSLFGVGWYGLDIPRHLINYSDGALVRLLEEEGFSIRRQKRFSLRDDAAAWVSSLFPSLDPLARTIRQSTRRDRSSFVPWIGIFQNFVYFLLWMIALPVALLDSLSGRGATFMVEAGRPLKDLGDKLQA